MIDHEFLSLRLIRLKSLEHWSSEGDGLSLIFPKGGRGTFVRDSIIQPLAPGDVFVVNSSSGGSLCVSQNEEFVFRCFSICSEHLYPLLATKEISLLQSVTAGFSENRLYAASHPIAVECHKLLGEVPPQFNFTHRSQLLRIVAAIMSLEFRNARPQQSGFIRIEEHLSQTLEKLSVYDILHQPVTTLAERFGCSQRHLNRLFHQHFGHSVGALRMEMRLLKAICLLRDPNAKVIYVAEQCGFNHLGLFNVCFKRRFGVSPGHWRKSPKESHAAAEKSLQSDSHCSMRSMGLCPWIGDRALKTGKACMEGDSQAAGLTK
jgi:AraC-like DNA-binding protein